MENAKPFVIAAVVAAAAALVLSVTAIVEIYTPSRIAAIASFGVSSRLSELERKIAAQEDILNRLEAAQDTTPASVQKTEAAIKAFRDAAQSAFNQVGSEISSMKSQISKLEEQIKERPLIKVEAKSASPVSKAGASPYLTHRATAGDTLASIAEKYSVAEEDIVSINPPWLDFSHLNAGQTIYVPR